MGRQGHPIRAAQLTLTGQTTRKARLLRRPIPTARRIRPARRHIPAEPLTRHRRRHTPEVRLTLVQFPRRRSQVQAITEQRIFQPISAAVLAVCAVS